jgi:hypothetical protein
LVRNWNPETKILNTFPAFVLRILCGRVKKLQKVPLKRDLLLEIGQHGGKKNLKCMLNLDFKQYFLKHARKK